MGFWLSSVTKVLLGVQAALASVSGIVTDGESGEGLGGAIVTLSDLDRSAVTDSSGRYVLFDVPAGPQHVTVTRIGYGERTLHALVPREGAIEINIALPPEPISLDPIEVEVHSAVPVRGLDEGDSTAFPDRGLSMAAVRAHPLLAEPDVFQALAGGEVVLRPESPSGIHVRGGASDQVTYLLDGIPILSPYHAGGTFSAWNPDALSRLELLGSSPPPGFPESLSGAVSALTRTPSAQFRTQGAVTTTQARVTVDGPIGPPGAGYLLSLRKGFLGVPYPDDDPSYLGGENGDWLAKLESPLLEGRVRLLAYDNESEIDAAAFSESQATGRPDIDQARNVFEWHSMSVGGEWARRFGTVAARFRAWSAAADADAVWTLAQDSLPEHLRAERRDEGLVAAVELEGDGRSTTAGVRVQRSRSSYEAGPASGDSPAVRLRASTPVSAAFVRHAHSVGRSSELELALVGAVAASDFHLSPRLQLRWRPSPALAVSGSVARLHQFAQSLRNPESVVGTIFPVDLYLGAAGEGVPVARSDQGIVALELRPTSGVRLGVQGYVRDFEGLALVAPRDGDPFARSGFVVGAGDAQGVSFEASANGARYGILASYGLQQVHLEYGEPADTTYVPDHGATHSLEGGVIVFPSTTSSVRLGAISVIGRRTTPTAGSLEFEACNLLDKGCEFVGSPRNQPDLLGTTSLPAYVRVDLGVTKHWHLKLADREGLVSVFGTVTNLLGRKNVLTIATDPETGEVGEVVMRPRSPLVVGIDWRF